MEKRPRIPAWPGTIGMRQTPTLPSAATQQAQLQMLGWGTNPAPGNADASAIGNYIRMNQGITDYGPGVGRNPQFGTSIVGKDVPAPSASVGNILATVAPTASSTVPAIAANTAMSPDSFAAPTNFSGTGLTGPSTWNPAELNFSNLSGPMSTAQGANLLGDVTNVAAAPGLMDSIKKWNTDLFGSKDAPGPLTTGLGMLNALNSFSMGRAQIKMGKQQVANQGRVIDAQLGELAANRAEYEDRKRRETEFYNQQRTRTA